VLIVALSTLALNILLDGIDLRLVLNELLLNVVQPVVDFTLQDLILLGIMLHVVVGDLLGKSILVHLQEFLDGTHSDLFIIELSLQIFSLGELVLHLILHSLDLLLGLLHLLVDSTLQVLNLIQIILDLLLLNSQPGGCVLSVFELALLELQVGTHVLDLLLSGQLVLPCHCLLHMLKQLSNDMLILLDFLFILHFLGFKLLCEFVDLLLFLVENLILLLFTGLSVLLSEILVNFLDVLVVLVDHLLHIEDLFVHLLDLSIVLLDTVLESFSCLVEQIHFIGLKLKIFLFLHEGGSLLLEMLGSLLKCIRSEFALRLGKSQVDLLQLVSGVGNFLVKHIVLLLQSLVLVSLFWVQIVQFGLVLVVDLLDLGLI